MTLDDRTDGKLTQFLKQHQPEAPPPAAGEEQRILRALRRRQSRVHRLSLPGRWSFALPVLAAAALVAGILFLPRTLQDLWHPTGDATADSKLEEFFDSSAAALSGEEVSEGSEWLVLAALTRPGAVEDLKVEEFLEEVVGDTGDDSLQENPPEDAAPDWLEFVDPTSES